MTAEPPGSAGRRQASSSAASISPRYERSLRPGLASTHRTLATSAILGRGLARNACLFLLEHALRVRDDQDLAVGIAQHVIDGRAEETRLAAPARRRTEHDEVGRMGLRLADDRLADRSGSDDLGPDRHAVQ